MNPTWTILIPTIGRRAESFSKLVRVNLLPQVEEYDGDVTIYALWNNGERPLGVIRQELVQCATSTYVSFIDDDDEIPYFYVERVYEALDAGCDYVGWRMQCYVNGEPLKPTYHSIRYPGWFDDERGYYRDVSHLNPIKREIALRADFRRGDPPEDVSWADQVRPHVHTEYDLGPDLIMYHYHSSPEDSTWRPGSVVNQGHRRVEIDHPLFSYHPWSYEND